MQKESLIKRAEKWQEESRKMPLMGYPKQGQEETLKISTAIIKTICEHENVTPHIAKTALKMAGDIISEEMEHDPIVNEISDKQINDWCRQYSENFQASLEESRRK